MKQQEHTVRKCGAARRQGCRQTPTVYQENPKFLQEVTLIRRTANITEHHAVLFSSKMHKHRPLLPMCGRHLAREFPRD